MVVYYHHLNGTYRNVRRNGHLYHFLGTLHFTKGHFTRKTRRLVFRHRKTVLYTGCFTLGLFWFLDCVSFTVYRNLLSCMNFQRRVFVKVNSLSVVSRGTIVTRLRLKGAHFLTLTHLCYNGGTYTVLRGKTGLIRLLIVTQFCRSTLTRHGQEFLQGNTTCGIFGVLGQVCTTTCVFGRNALTTYRGQFCLQRPLRNLLGQFGLLYVYH